MGTKIKGAGSNQIQIEGVKNLKKDVSYNIMPDRIEAGTFLCLAAMTNGKMKLKHVDTNHITPIIYKLEEAGCNFKIQKNEIEIQAPKRLKAVDIKTMPYPRISNRYAVNIWSNTHSSQRNISNSRKYI